MREGKFISVNNFSAQEHASSKSGHILSFRVMAVRDIKQLLDEVEHDIMNYQNRGLCYLPKPKADNTDLRF